MACLLLRSPDLLEDLVLPLLEDYSRHTPATSMAVTVTAQVPPGMGSAAKFMR